MTIRFSKSDVNFMSVLRRRVNQYFESSKLHPTGGSTILVKAWILIATLVLVYLAPFFLPPGLGLAKLSVYAFEGVLMALIGFNLMHDGSHGSFSRNPKINQAMAYSLNLLGGNAFLWKQKHCINHHTYTNVEHLDDDIDLRPFLRLHSDQKYFWFHRFQHLYAGFLYCFTLLFWIHYRDYKKYFTRKIADQTEMAEMDTREHLVFWVSKVLHIGLFLVVPSLFMGFVPVLLGYLLMGITCGFTLAVVFQLAHIVEGTRFETAEEETRVCEIPSEWSVHQIHTTVNFATRNPVWTWLLGGLNYQMVHHLFPKISHVHYPAIHHIIIDCCKEYGVSYVEFPSLRSALSSHFRQLRAMGQMA